MTTLEQRSSRLRQVPNRFQIRRTILEHLATRLIAEFERGAGWLFPSYWGEFTDFQKEIYNSHLEDAVELASKYLRYREKPRKSAPCTVEVSANPIQNRKTGT